MQAPTSSPSNLPTNTNSIIPTQNEPQPHTPNVVKQQSTGLVNEDANIEIQAENHLLAQTTFEEMNLDPRFINAL